MKTKYCCLFYNQILKEIQNEIKDFLKKTKNIHEREKKWKKDKNEKKLIIIFI